MDKNPATNAGDRDSSPSPGRFHLPKGQLSLCAVTTEPQERRSHCNKKPAGHSAEWPLTATRESLTAATKTQSSQK